MWKTILKWLLKFALEQLGADVDAESQKAIDDYNEKRAALEKRRADSEEGLKKLSDQWLDLVAKRTKYSSDIEFLQEQIKTQDETLRRLENEKEQKLNLIRNSDDDSILHGDLPGADQS